MSCILQGCACCDVLCIEIRAQMNQRLHRLDEAAACEIVKVNCQGTDLCRSGWRAQAAGACAASTALLPDAAASLLVHSTSQPQPEADTILTSCQVQRSVLGIVSGINRAASVKQGLYDASLSKCSSIVQRRASVLHTAPSMNHLQLSGDNVARQVTERWLENAGGVIGACSLQSNIIAGIS